MMKVIAIVGSLRRRGFTYPATRRFFGPLKKAAGAAFDWAARSIYANRRSAYA